MRGTTTHNISEHLPLTLVQNLDFMCVLMMFFSILIFTDTKIRLSDLFMLRWIITALILHKKTNINVCINLCFNIKQINKFNV